MPDTPATQLDTPADRLLVSISDARALLGGISRTTVYELIDRGEIVKVKIGARGFVTAKSIAAYVDRLTQAAHV